MKTEMTDTGWIDTVVTTHRIKIAKGIMSVSGWNAFNVKHPKIGQHRQHCDRCKTLWTAIPGEQDVTICMMEKEINRCICEKCRSEIDQSLIIK